MENTTRRARRSAAAAERFWPKVDKGDGEGCWLWTASRDRNGYGRFNTGSGGPTLKAHVWAWEQVHGPKTPGMDIDHLCGVRACVRADGHLEQVTHRENLLRGNGFVAQAASATHCPQGHPYDEANTYSPPAGGRTCRACRKVRATAVNDRRREDNAALGVGRGRNRRTLGSS